MSANTPDAGSESADGPNEYVQEVQAVLEDNKATIVAVLSNADRTKTYFSDPTSSDPVELALATLSRGLEYKHFPDDLEKVRAMKKTVQTWIRDIDPKAQLEADDLGGNDFEVKLSFLG